MDENQQKVLRLIEELQGKYVEARELQSKTERVRRDIGRLEEELEVLTGKRQPSSFSPPIII